MADAVDGPDAQHEERRAGDALRGERPGRAACDDPAVPQELVACDAAVVLRGAEHDRHAVGCDGRDAQRGRPARRVGVALRAHDDLRDVRPARVDPARRAHLPEPAPRREQQARGRVAHVDRLHLGREAPVACDPQVVAPGAPGLVPAERHPRGLDDRARGGRRLLRPRRAPGGACRYGRNRDCQDKRDTHRNGPRPSRGMPAHTCAYRLGHWPLAPPRGGTLPSLGEP